MSRIVSCHRQSRDDRGVVDGRDCTREKVLPFPEPHLAGFALRAKGNSTITLSRKPTSAHGPYTLRALLALLLTTDCKP